MIFRNQKLGKGVLLELKLALIDYEIIVIKRLYSYLKLAGLIDWNQLTQPADIQERK